MWRDPPSADAPAPPADDPRARDLLRRHLRRRRRRATARCARASARRRTSCTRASAASCPRSPRGGTSSSSCRSSRPRSPRPGRRSATSPRSRSTQGPGLIGALLVGLSAGKALAYARGAAARAGRPPARPRRRAAARAARARAAVRVPAGLGRAHARARRAPTTRRPRRLGGTRDDAAGEAFDKGARLLGLSEAGRRRRSSASRARGDPERFPFPLVLRGQAGHDLSFSGLKTALLRRVRELGDALPEARADLAASYQAAIVAAARRARRGRARRHGPRRRSPSSAASRPTARCAPRSAEVCARRGARLCLLPPALCVDNAAMIARRGVRGAGARSRPSTSRSTPTRAARWRGRPRERAERPCGRVPSAGHDAPPPLAHAHARSLARGSARRGRRAPRAGRARSARSGALRSWDAVIGDGRSGEPLPLQVIVVLAAPPAARDRRPGRGRRPRRATQQLDLDALTRVGIVRERAVPLRQRAQRRRRRRCAPTSSRSCARRPQVAGVYPVRKLYPAATVAEQLASLGRARRARSRARARAAA